MGNQQDKSAFGAGGAGAQNDKKSAQPEESQYMRQLRQELQDMDMDEDPEDDREVAGINNPQSSTTLGKRKRRLQLLTELLKLRLRF